MPEIMQRLVEVRSSSSLILIVQIQILVENVVFIVLSLHEVCIRIPCLL